MPSESAYDAMCAEVQRLDEEVLKLREQAGNGWVYLLLDDIGRPIAAFRGFGYANDKKRELRGRTILALPIRGGE